jgi:hypothetical protein
MFYAGFRIVSKFLVILQTSEYPDSDYMLILVRSYHRSYDLPDNFVHRIIVIDHNALH